MTEHINLDIRGDWLRLRLDLEYPPANPHETLHQAAAEELWLASRVLLLAGRTLYTTPGDEHRDALAYLDRIIADTHDEHDPELYVVDDLDFSDYSDDVDDEDQAGDEEHDQPPAVPDPADDTFARLRAEPDPPTITPDDVMRAAMSLTAAEKLAPGVPLARALGIPGRACGPYVRMARSRGWLPEITHTGTDA